MYTPTLQNRTTPWRGKIAVEGRGSRLLERGQSLCARRTGLAVQPHRCVRSGQRANACGRCGTNTRCSRRCWPRRRSGVHGRSGRVFFALDARTGNKLWSFQTGSGHRGSAISYSVKGRQYIATPTGWGSIAGRALVSLWPEAETFRAGSTLMVFALPEAQ